MMPIVAPFTVENLETEVGELRKGHALVWMRRADTHDAFAARIKRVGIVNHMDEAAVSAIRPQRPVLVLGQGAGS
jgi:hypothetical protein